MAEFTTLSVASAFGCSTLILLATAAYLVVGVVVFAVWQLTGSDIWIEDFFRIPGALLMVCMSAAGLFSIRRVNRGFFPGEPIRIVWELIAASAM